MEAFPARTGRRGADREIPNKQLNYGGAPFHWMFSSRERWSAEQSPMATVTKKELIDRIAENESCKRVDVKRIVQTFLDSIVQELADGNRLEFRDFGVFECRMRASRDAQNPKTMAKVKVPPKRTVKFKAGRVMKIRLHETPAEIDEATGLAVEASAQRPKAAAIAAGD